MNVVGIDLGTTYSLVAVVQADGKPFVIPNAVGEILTPSVVHVTRDGAIEVGALAAARLVTAPAQTAANFKRDMGTDRTYTLGKRAFTPQQLSAFVLESLKRDAEAFLGEPISEAVVTVPAYFGELQRRATRDAAEIAGLHVERIINEPTAAAMAYGLHQRDRQVRAVVLDLGGGTFDVTVLEILEGVIEIQSSAGDARLGGEDFLMAIVETIDHRIGAAHGSGVRRGTQSWAVLRDAAERAKRRLSESDRTDVLLPDLELEAGKRADVELTLTRADAEDAWAPVLARLREPALRALRDAKLEPSGAEEVLLVGGATRMPCVARYFARLFGRMPLRTLPPDEAVAQGAAIQVALKVGNGAVDELVVTDVAPFSMGISTLQRHAGVHVDGVYAPIMDRGTTIPASRMQRFWTVHDMQVHIDVEVYQGEHTRVEQNQRLGEFQVEVPRRPAGEESIDVRFTYDLNGLLEVEATVVSTGQARAAVFERVPGRMTPEQIEAARAEMQQLKHHPREELPNSVALSRAEALYVQLTGPPRNELGKLIAAFRAALERQEPAEIDGLRAVLNRAVSASST